MMNGRKLNRHLFYLILIILLGFWLRLYNAEAFGFWTDEGLTPLRSSYTISTILSNKIFIQEAVSTDTHPPLYYLLVHFSRQLWGETDFAYRYPSLLASLFLIPLLYQFGRRLSSTRLGLIAALYTAVNPLQVWYANEARMYALLALLTAAASYVLWRALQPQLPAARHSRGLSLRSYLVLYIVLAGLAFYTHYTTIFLIAAQGLFWVWLLWRSGYKKLIAVTAVCGLLLAIPLIPFTIPRLFTGAEANYFYVQPLIMLQDVVRFFHLGLSVDFQEPLIILLNIAALGLLLLGVYTARPNMKRAFLLIYLLAVVLGLMAGSLLKPMYQGVRHIMVGSPAFMLLLSLGLTFSLNRSLLLVRSPIRHGRRWLWSVVSIAAILVIFGGSLLSLFNLYFVERFGKDDYRQMIQFIEERAGQNEAIVYNNAILLPLHAHYQTRSDIEVTASPIYPHQAWPSAPEQLASLVNTYDRIWFVTDPPADGRDRNRLVRRWLQENLTAVDNVLFPARTVEIRTIVYDTKPQTATELPKNGIPLGHEWPELPTLVGAELHFSQPASLPTLWFSLYWQGEPPDPKTAAVYYLADENGRDWWGKFVQRLMPADSQWPQSALARQSVQLPLLPGTPPGTYTLMMQPMTQVEGELIGPARALAEVTISPGNQWLLPQDTRPTPVVAFANGMALQTVEIFDEEVRPGHTLPLNLLWYTGAAIPTDPSYELVVVGPDGEPLRTDSDQLGPPWLAAWPEQTLLREPTGIYFPPDTKPGTYTLHWQLKEGEEVIGARPAWQPWYANSTAAGQVEVMPWPLVTDLPVAVPLAGASFGPDIELYGYEREIALGKLDITLYWQALNAPESNQVVFLHLLNEEGQIVSQLDRIPVAGLRPTLGWRAGEVVTDEYALPLPADLPPGVYTLWLGMYQPDSGARLPVSAAGVPQPDGRYRLTTVTLD